MHHDLKIVQPFFGRVQSGEKTFEFRKNDRDFQAGDTVALQEYDPKTNTYSGYVVFADITYVLREFPGMDSGFCVFSFKKV